MFKFSVLFFSFVMVLHAQRFESQQVKDWVHHHPNVKLISGKSFLQYNDLEQMDMLQRPYVIVFEGDVLKWKDILKYEEQIGVKEDGVWVQRWLAAHPDVKYMSREDFNTLSTSRKQIYQTQNVLITEKKLPTKYEILSYED